MKELFYTSKVYHIVQVVLTLLSVELVHKSSATESCPSPCSCTPVAETNQVAVDCAGKNISILPTNFPQNVVEISLNHNPLHSILLQSFSKLPSLKKLFLAKCQLEEVHWEVSGDDTGTQNFHLHTLIVLDLMNNQLKEIPKNLPASINILHIGSNFIETVEGKTISRLHNLRELFLDNNKIASIDIDCFSNISSEKPSSKDEDNPPSLSKLEKLVLNSNRITNIASSSFQGMQSLTALTLSRNRLNILNENTFKGLHRLQHLDLSYNRITEVPAKTFDGVKFLKYLNLNNNRLHEVPSSLPMLEWLDLSHNRISNVSEDLKPVVFPAEVFNFAHNPLHCDCKLLWLKELYDRREYLVKYIEVSPEDFIPSCVSPRKLAGERWDNLGDELFVCEEDSEEPTIYEDPLIRKPKSQMERLKIKSGTITDGAIQIFWTHLPPVSYINVFVQYYIFGMRGTTVKHVEISAAQQEYTLRHLRFETNYVVCVIPKLSESEDDELQPMSLNHCLEVQTKAKVVVVENVSYLSLVSWYILGMMGTVIFIFSCVGLLALVYGLYSSKTDWSAKYAQEEIQVDAPTDSTTDDTQPTHVSGDSVIPPSASKQTKDKTE